MSARWYKRCGADFIHGTMMLTLEEKGAYSLCLDLIYDRGAPIPDDARWLSGVCGVSMRKWASMRERLVSLGKLAAVEGHLSNSRADFELVSAELQRRNQAEAGAKGGRKRAENAAAANENSDLTQATLKPIEEIREEEKEEDEATPHSHARANPFPRPDWADKQVWADFMANRKRRRMTNSATAYRQFLSDIAKFTDDDWPPGRLLEHATGKSWGSINDPRNSLGNQQNGHSKSPARQGNNLQGSRPSPALALQRRGAAREAEEARFGEDGAPDRGAWPALPAIGAGGP